MADLFNWAAPTTLKRGYNYAAGAGLKTNPALFALDKLGSSHASFLRGQLADDLFDNASADAATVDRIFAMNVAAGQEDLDTITSVDALPSWLQMETQYGSFLSGTIQFLAPFSKVQKGFQGIKLIKALKPTTLKGKVMRYAGTVLPAGAVTDFFFFKGTEGHLSDFALANGFDNPLTRWLATDEDDSWLEGRAKNTIEGIMVSPPADFILGGFRGLKKTKPGQVAEVPVMTKEDVRAATEQGEVDPVVAEAHGVGWEPENVDWDDPVLDRQNLPRQYIRETLLRSGMDEARVDNDLAILDMHAATQVKRGNVPSLEDWYKNYGPKVQVKNVGDGTPAPDTLFQMRPSAADGRMYTPVNVEKADSIGFGTARKLPSKASNTVTIDQVLENLDSFQRQTADLDFADPEQATAFFSHMADPTGTEVPRPPAFLVAARKDPQVIIDSLRPGIEANPRLVQGAAEGVKNAQVLGEAYRSGSATAEHTLGLMTWGAASARASPYPHEGGALSVITHPLWKEFSLKITEGEYDGSLAREIVEHATREARPGRQAVNNFNQFLLSTVTDKGKYKVSGAEELAAIGPDGTTGLSKIHAIYADSNLTQAARRRALLRTGLKTKGLGLKIHDFTGLVSGHFDAIVLDRVRYSALWSDPEFGPYYNYYDLGQNSGGLSSLTGKFEDTRSIAVIEKLESELNKSLSEVWGDLSDIIPPELQNLGGYHWLDWVIRSSQDVDHGSINVITGLASGKSLNEVRPIAKASEGRFYHMDAGASYWAIDDVVTWQGPFDKTFVFSPEDFAEFRKTFANPYADGGALPDEWKARMDAFNASRKEAEPGTRAQPFLRFGTALDTNVIPEVNGRPWYDNLGEDELTRLKTQAEEFASEIHDDGYKPAGKPAEELPESAGRADESIADQSGAGSRLEPAEGQSPATGRSGEGTESVPHAGSPVARFDGPQQYRLIHFSGADRSKSGISRRFAGTANAGRERVSYEGAARGADGGLEDESLGMVHAYLPGARPEANLGIGTSTDTMHTVTGEYNLLATGSDAARQFDDITDLAELRQAVEAAGYDGIVDPERGMVQLLRDVSPDEIKRTNSVEPAEAQAWSKGKARLAQSTPDAAEVRGRITFREGEKPLIELFESADESTLVHEFSHLVRRNLEELDPELHAKAEAAYKVEDGNWTVEAEEAFATDFEHYLRTGEAPTEELKSVFAYFKEVLTKVYADILAKGEINVSQEARDLFDLVLGKEFNRADINRPRPSSRPPNRPLASVRAVRQAYAQKQGQLLAATGMPYAEIDEVASKRIADAYGKMKHRPNDPKVKESYDALTTETLDQYESIIESGHRLVFTRKDPYSSSQALVDDIDANQRMYVFLTEEGSLPADHPMAAKTGIIVKTPEGEEIDLLVNDVFRGVHDFFGHASEGYQFGHRGEENAWLLHSAMYSDVARPAMTTETRGQNSWVNAGQHLRRPDGTLPRRGDYDFVHPKDRAFATQKAGLLPKYAQTPPKQVARLADAPPKVVQKDVATTLNQAKKAGYKGVQALEQAVGTHINYARLRVSDDVVRALNEIEPVAQKLIDEDIGAEQANEVTAALAEELGADPADVLRALSEAGQRNNAAYMVAGRTLRNTVMNEAAEIAKKIELRGQAGEDITELAEQLTAATAATVRVDMIVGEAQKSLARGVQSGNIVTSVGNLDPEVSKALADAMRTGERMRENISRAIDSAVAQGNKNIADALSEVGRASNPKIAQGVAAAIADASKVGEQARMIRRLNEAKDPGWIEKIVEFRGAMILSGPRTFAINWGVGAPSSVYHAMARTLGAGVTLNRAELKSSMREMVNLVGAARDILGMFVLNNSKMVAPDVRQGFKNTIKNELPNLTGTSVTENRSAIKGTKGRLVRIPYVINSLGEEFWSQINYLAAVRTQAMDEADKIIWNDPNIRDEDRAGAFLQYVDQYVRDSYDEAGRVARDADGRVKHEEALRKAKQVNFMQDLEYGFGKDLLELKRKHPVVGLIQPFFKAPTNLFRTAVRMTPVIGQAQEFAARRAVNMSDQQKTQHVGEMVLGAALWGYAAYLGATGQTTGHGPSNKTERDALIQAGWQPYSVVRTDADGKKHYTSFLRVDPWATILGLAADLSDVRGYMETGEADQIGDAMVDSVIHNFTNKLYTRGISDFLEAITDTDKPIDNYVNNYVGSFLPNFGRQIAEATDSEYRQARTMLDAIKQRVPGWAETLPPRRNVLGKPTSPRGAWIPFVNDESAVARTASPLSFTEGTDNEVLQEFARLQFGFGMPSERMSGIDIGKRSMPNGQNTYDRYVELSGSIRLGGKDLEQSVEELIKSPAYRSLPDVTGNRDIDKYNQRIVVISRVIRAYRNAAKNQLLQEDPELAQEIRLMRLQGVTGTLPSTGGPLSAFDLLD